MSPHFLQPIPLPIGGLNFCEEIRDAVVAEINGIKADIGVEYVAPLYETRGKVQAFRADQLPAVVVAAYPLDADYESCGYIGAKVAVTWIVQGRKVSILTAFDDLAKIMLNIIGLFKNAGFDGSVRLCPISGNQSWIEGFSISKPEQNRKDPYVVTAQGTMNVRVVYLDPMR